MDHPPKVSTPPPGYRPPSQEVQPPVSATEPGPSLDPLSRRLLSLAGVLAVLVILLAAFSLLHDGGSSPFSPNPIALAAERASTEPGGKMTMEATYFLGASGQTMTMSGNGAYDPLSASARVAMAISAPALGRNVDFEVVLTGERGYMRSSMLTPGLPPGKEWIGMDASDFGGSGDAMAGADPSDQLELLQEVGGTVTTLGRERVRGTMTTRYRGVIPIAAFAKAIEDQGQDDVAEALESAQGTVDAEAWVDDAGRIRQMRIVMSAAPATGAPALTMDMRMEFFGFGTHPVIAPPPATSVLEADEAGIDPGLLS